MAAQRRRSPRDRRRRNYGQNFLTDPQVVERLLTRIAIQPGERIVDIGAGTGAITLPLARAGAQVLAIERDSHWVAQLQRTIEAEGLASRVQLRRADLRTVPLPRNGYRVVASPPYGLTTTLLRRLLDDPTAGPVRADLLLQWDVARKRAATPADTLRSAAWAPWWQFELGERVAADAFRPRPAVDSGWLHIVRRDPPILPTSLARQFYDALKTRW